MAKSAKSSWASLKSLLIKPVNKLWSGAWWKKIILSIVVLILAFLGLSYGVAEWYVHKHNKEPLTLGTTFVPDYARSFGLDPHQTLNAIFADLGIRQVRLVSYWNNVEPKPGVYNFKELDSEFALANQYGAKVSLAVGMRQPRWPECHEPAWIDASAPESQWEPQLYDYMTTVINRYKNNPALSDYQLENEYFMKVFGECKNFDRDRLVAEFNLVKKLDPAHPVVISRSDNWVGIPVGQPTPDEFGISVYKRVWDGVFTHRYFEYPLPPWFYASLAGYEELLSGKAMIIHELQAEPWAPGSKTIQQISLDEQYKSMNAARMQSRINYGEETGMRSIDLWGAEWWYWLKVKQNDPAVWNVVKQNVAEVKTQNQNLVDK